MSSDEFPFNKAWNLNTKDLMWYLTMDQVLDLKWKVDYNVENPGGGNQINTIQDEDYVFRNIIKDDDTIHFMSKETQFEPNKYCFVDQNHVIHYLRALLKYNPESQVIEVGTNEEGKSL